VAHRTQAEKVKEQLAEYRGALQDLEKYVDDFTQFLDADEERAKFILEFVLNLDSKSTSRLLTRVRRARARRADPQPETHTSQSSEPHFRGNLAKTGYGCISQAKGTFTARDLVGQMRSAGYQFFGHPDVSVGELLRKFVKDQIVEIVEPGAGRRATVYRRREVPKQRV
jgi:hypothetical protein